MALVLGNHWQALCWAALMTLVAPVAAPLAALGLQQTPAGVALMALQWVWLKLWLVPQQTSDEAALVALVLGKHWQAPCWAALVTSRWQAECQ